MQVSHSISKTKALLTFAHTVYTVPMKTKAIGQIL